MGLMKAKPVTDAADAVDRAITEGLLDCIFFYFSVNNDRKKKNALLFVCEAGRLSNQEWV